MTPTEASTLNPGDRVEFSDPALAYCCAPARGIVVWVVRGEPGTCEHEVGISWEGIPAVSQDPAADFEHVRLIN